MLAPQGSPPRRVPCTSPLPGPLGSSRAGRAWGGRVRLGGYVSFSKARGTFTTAYK